MNKNTMKSNATMDFLPIVGILLVKSFLPLEIPTADSLALSLIHYVLHLQSQ